MSLRAGIDLGGTKIEIVVLDESNEMLFRHRVQTPQGNYLQTLLAIKALVGLAEQNVGEIPAVGVGIPGALSHRTGRVKNANSVCLIGQDLSADLKQLLNRPVVLSNDANCFALSEASDGAGKDAEVVFGVIIGTGCGGGLVVNGQILNGHNSIAGEWGHNPLPWATPEDEALPCYCGLQGCLETFLSGTGFSQHYQLRKGHSLSAPEIMTSIAVDRVAAKLFDDYCLWLAKGLASVINLVDPDVIVLGGGMSNIEALYERVPQLWSQWVFSDSVDTQLRQAKWGDSSGVRGAAWLS